MSFLASYFDKMDGTGENAICCPFPHLLSDGTEYYESRPSAHVNTTKLVYHCKACDRRYDEIGFIQAITGCAKDEALDLSRIFKETNTIFEWEAETELTEGSHDKAIELGISEDVIHELKIRTPPKGDGMLSFPVFAYDQLVDIRQYNPGGNPKIKSLRGATNGMIIPFDIWRQTETKRITLICAGEKDMAIARTHGFNAITITGGEKSTPKFLNFFKNRAVAIVYDNDDAGKTGALKLAKTLYPYTQNIKVVTNFHEICKEKGEDITDFFTKYNKTRKDLINYIKLTEPFIPDMADEVTNKEFPLVDLYEASQNYVNKIVRTNVQVVATYETVYRAPSTIVATKKEEAVGAVNTMITGESKTWKLENKNCDDVLYLIDSALKEKQISDNIRNELFRKPAERNLHFKILDETTVYKVIVTDLYETTDKNIQPMEYVAYSIGQKLESGKKYTIMHKLAPHPYKGQQLVMIILDVKQASDSVSNFMVSDRVVKNLKLFQDIKGTIPEKIQTLTEMHKQFIGYNGINKLIETIDLSFNTPLRFNFGRIKNIRAYLDTLIVGESRTGKSSTADALRKLYGLGTFTSLAGNSATIAGLVGGSSKTSAGSMQTRAGIIPQNNMGLIIFEEFGKSSKDVLRELTDIRSSNEVRITRVSGTLTLPAYVRMISLTNVKTSNNEIKSIASYPNGISIITELVSTAEDIARYDNILILADTGQTDIDPLWEPVKALPQDAYRDRIRWIWTRTPEQILIAPEIEKYIIEENNRLNKEYPSHIKLFGTEAWKKISRLAIAIAGYIVSASENYQDLIVTKECVDYAVQYLIDLYDNSTFKFKEYVQMELRYQTTNEEAKSNLQGIYDKFPSLILQLEQQVDITRAMLESTTGLEPQELRKGLQQLTKGYFIKVDNTTIVPTERFRKTLRNINKGTHIGRVGEV